MLISRGSLGIFFSNALVATLMGIGILFLIIPLVGQLRSRRTMARPAL
jgi:TctA family transporter